MAAVLSVVSVNKRLKADMPYAARKQFSALWFFLICFLIVIAAIPAIIK